ncbi:hypothetical protein [Enterovirga sp. CN4-39]|uniref:hypothetical protein n=1 Tax=Enterovirga sp. CN4-39 TaxID=3400910 RepID=UPI003BFEDAE3
MSARIVASGLLLCLAAIPLAAPAQADPAKDYLFQERQLRTFCQPPLKFAAGACMPYCPAGFEDLGSYCRLYNQSSQSSRW